MSAELVPINNAIVEASDRRAALERLSAAAEAADSPEQAHEIMVKGRIASDLLTQMQAPYEEAWLAGKASLLATRRLGVLFLELSADRVYMKGQRGALISERGAMRQQLGINKTTSQRILRLARVDDDDFQRYIQDRSQIPAVNGALLSCYPKLARVANDGKTHEKRRRRRVGIKQHAHPSLDEGYALITQALGRLDCNWGGGVTMKHDLARAIDHLYAAEDLLKPYRAGYGE